MSEREVMMPLATEEAMRQSELLIMRGIHDSLQRMNSRQDNHAAKQDAMVVTMGDIKVTLARMEERQLVTAKLEATCEELEKRVNALEGVQDKQQGAMNLGTWLKDFGPWIGTLFLLAWGLFMRKPA